MPQPFIFKTASFFPKAVSFEESLGGAGWGGRMSSSLEGILGAGVRVPG